MSEIENKIGGICQDCMYLSKIMPIIEQLQEENEEINNILYSPEKRFTNCPKCGEKDLINYSREVYILEDKINKAFQIVTDIKSQIKLCLDELEEKRERGEISYRDIEDIRYIYEDIEKLVLSLEEGEE